MNKSESIARVAGPTLIVMVGSELAVWNPTLYEDQTSPVVYLSGVLLFVAGISIINKHNIWVFSWQVIITALGWSCLLLGAYRTLFPDRFRLPKENNNLVLLMEITLIILGLILTAKGYRFRIKQAAN